MRLKELVLYGGVLVMAAGLGCGKKEDTAKEGKKMTSEPSFEKERVIELPNGSGKKLTFKRIGGPDMVESTKTKLSGKLRFLVTMPDSALLAPEDRASSKILVMDVDGGETIVLSGNPTAVLRKNAGKKADIIAIPLRNEVPILGNTYKAFEILEVVNID